MMTIDIYADGFQLTPRLRAFAESRLLAALRPFHEHIASAIMNLRVRTGRSQPGITGCDVVVALHPSGEHVGAGAREPRMQEAIDRAAERIREAVRHAVSRPVVGRPVGHGALDVVLDGNRISHQEREWLERPENEMRPVVVRELWRPSEVEHREPAEERDHALANVR
jgi:ribosome-associated translation inhibitor RaiA